MLSIHGKNNSDGSFNWHDALIDAGILALLTFFTSLGGLSATGVVSMREIVAAGISAATQFFMTLSLKRGLREKSKKKP